MVVTDNKPQPMAAGPSKGADWAIKTKPQQPKPVPNQRLARDGVFVGGRCVQALPMASRPMAKSMGTSSVLKSTAKAESTLST
jgi:hypothetical protein